MWLNSSLHCILFIYLFTFLPLEMLNLYYSRVRFSNEASVRKGIITNTILGVSVRYLYLELDVANEILISANWHPTAYYKISVLTLISFFYQSRATRRTPNTWLGRASWRLYYRNGIFSITNLLGPRQMHQNYLEKNVDFWYCNDKLFSKLDGDIKELYIYPLLNCITAFSPSNCLNLGM